MPGPCDGFPQAAAATRPPAPALRVAAAVAAQCEGQRLHRRETVLDADHARADSSPAAAGRVGIGSLGLGESAVDWGTGLARIHRPREKAGVTASKVPAAPRRGIRAPNHSAFSA